MHCAMNHTSHVGDGLVHGVYPRLADIHMVMYVAAVNLNPTREGDLSMLPCLASLLRR